MGTEESTCGDMEEREEGACREQEEGCVREELVGEEGCVREKLVGDEGHIVMPRCLALMQAAWPLGSTCCHCLKVVCVCVWVDG